MIMIRVAASKYTKCSIMYANTLLIIQYCVLISKDISAISQEVTSMFTEVK